MEQLPPRTDYVIVAHGAPSAPAGPEATLKALAASVQALCPGLKVRAATLAMPGSLQEALQGLAAPRIYPFFMAEGWFTRRELPRRLAELGSDATILPPFGSDPALPGIIVEALRPHGGGPVILAAHGSAVARSSKDSAYAVANAIRALLPGREVHVGLIEESPHLKDVAMQHQGGVCLPFFAMRAGHVEDDIPQALQAARFGGPLLPPIGERPEVPALIAQALLRA